MLTITSSNTLPLHGAAVTCQGGRPENQDDVGFYETPLGLLFIVCDGMGGGPGGKTASYIVKNEISQTLINGSVQIPPEKAIKAAVGIAQETLEKKCEEVPSIMGMGSTFVAVLICNNSAVIAHAGDSRCYLLRGKKMVFRTQDHSLVAELALKKILTEEEARTSPQSNVITRGLGCLSNNVPEITEIPYKKGDRFVLCTDGVWGIMPHNELIRRFTAKDNIKSILNKLSVEIDEIGNRSGGYHDNHTIAIIETASDSILKEKSRYTKIYITIALAILLIATIIYFLSTLIAFKNV